MRLCFYRHTQFGVVVVLALLLAAAVAAGAETLAGGPWWLIGIGPALMVVFLALFYALTVEIDETCLYFWFGVGLIRQRVPLSEIVDAQPARTTWIEGWGIHHTDRGWLYNVSGWDVVEITLASGKRLRLGTDEPTRLAQAILAARAAGLLAG